MLVNERPDEKRVVEFDPETSLREARARKPLKSVIMEYGHGPKNDNWKDFACPFCHKKNGAGLFVSESGAELFKCFHHTCPSGSKPLDEVGFIALQGNLSRKEAFTAYLKQAGIWKERERWQKRDEAPKPKEVGGTGFTAEELAEAIETGGTGSIKDDGDGTNPEPEEHQETRMEQGPVEESIKDEGERINGEAEKPQVIGDAEPAGDVPTAEGGQVGADAPTMNENQQDSSSTVVPFPGPTRKRSRSEIERDEETLALTVLGEFYDKLALTEEDQNKLWFKRGLNSKTQRALGYRSNNRGNSKILSELLDSYPDGALVRSGLFFRDKNSRELRFSGIYTGMGRTGEEQWEDEDGHKHERVVREYVQPILIPYWDAQGQLVHLRPHKDHPAGHPPMVYVPRGFGDPAATVGEAVAPTKFYRVVITEGEFKVGALWQMIGEGREDGEEPWGVAALPGINMARNEDVRWELDDWLQSVGAREVVVAYDRQDKATSTLADGQPNPSFNPDKTKRYDAEIWARFLAVDLTRKLHLNAKVCVLPEQWMDESLKADWDGALAKMVHAGDMGSGRRKKRRQREEVLA